MTPLEKALLLPLSTVASDSNDSSSDGTGRIDIAYALERLSAVCEQANQMGYELNRLRGEIGKLLNELDGIPDQHPDTEPHVVHSEG